MMSLIQKTSGLLFLLILGGIQCSCGEPQSSERKELFDKGWSFALGSYEDAINYSYDASSWRVVDLPHDWSIEPLEKQIPGVTVGPFSRESVGGIAVGQTVGGEGWYRKTFVISPEDADKRHELYFDGVYNQSEVWVNGQKAHYNAYGYSAFRFDITDYCNPAGQENVITVKVVNEGKNSRWYAGAGIYRHVWMIRTPKVFIDDWGTFIETEELKGNDAPIKLTTTVINGEGESSFTINVEVISPNGKRVARADDRVVVPPGDTLNIPFQLSVNRPELWSPETPVLYTARISLSDKEGQVDELSVPFGIRTIRFSADTGFELNGVPMKLKGGCVHHDNGLLGAASFDRAEERKIELLKANGFNAVRTSHNPMSESFMDACDRLGMLVIDEAFDSWRGQKNPQDYHLYFDEFSAKDIRAMVLRDRNRPSVIMWSIGNEIRERATEEGRETSNYLKNEILKYDTSRPVTAGVNKQWAPGRTDLVPLNNAFYYLDVNGYNYMWRFYEEEHESYPDRVMFGSESVAGESFYFWDMVEKHPYVIGDFIWTALDYLGESGLGNSLEIDPQENVHQFMDWPWFNAWCGDIDLLGIKKPQSYYRDILWQEREISMAVEAPVAEGKIRKVSFWGWREELLSWTFPGMENRDLRVNVYTRAPKVRLYLNDLLIGEKEVVDEYTACFDVPYQPGILKAVEVNGNKEGASVLLQTVGEPAGLRLTADQTTLKAQGQDLSYVLIELVDQQGNVVLDSDRKVTIDLSGVGRVIGSGNASPTDMESFGSLTPSLFRGRAMAIVRAGYESGNIEMSVAADGVKSSSIEIIVR